MSASYTTPATTGANSGTQYECVVTNSVSSVTSNPATLTVNPTPVSPCLYTSAGQYNRHCSCNRHLYSGRHGYADANLSMDAKESRGRLICGDQRCHQRLIHDCPQPHRRTTGTQFECVASNTSGSATSNAATLTVQVCPPHHQPAAKCDGHSTGHGHLHRLCYRQSRAKLSMDAGG